MNGSYPPIPYAPILAPSIPAKRRAEERFAEERESAQSTSTTRPPPPSSSTSRQTLTRTTRKTPAKKWTNPFSNGKLAPFKPVSRIAPTPAPTPLRTPKYTPPVSPSQSTSTLHKSPEAAQITLLKSPFKTPTFSLTPSRSNLGRSTSTVGLTRELAEVEGRVIMLRRAKTFLEADAEERDEGIDNLERLGTKWQIIGRKAADLLWEHTASSSYAPQHLTHPSYSLSPSDDAGTHPSKILEQQPNRSHTPSPSSSLSITQLSTYYSTSSSTSRAPESTSEFLMRIDQIARDSRRTKAEVLEGMMEGEEELPTLEQLWERERRATEVGRGNEVDDGRVGDEVIEEAEEEYDELDTPADQLAYARRITEEQRFTHPPENDDNPRDDAERAKWNVGEMMRRAGVDPDLFGSRNEQVDFD